MDAIPLCVPFARKDEARCAGARWDSARRLWSCDPALLATDAYRRLRPFVPRMYRPDLAPPYIRPWMVPQPLWGKNLRALLPQHEWDIVRRHAYDMAGSRCLVCGGRGPQWPVEADEAWDYDDVAWTHTLCGVIALCPDCHHIRHWGKSAIDGRENETFDRLMTINGWSRTTAEQVVDAAYAQWEQRSSHSWTSDYSWVTRVHGFVIDDAGHARADHANRSIVAEAKRQADEHERALGVEAMFGQGAIGIDDTSPPPSRPPAPPPRQRSILDALRSLFG